MSIGWRYWLVLVLIICGCGVRCVPAYSASQKPRVVKRLSECPVVSHRGTEIEDGGKVSIGGVIYDDSLSVFNSIWDPYSYISIYDIGRKYDYFEAWAGVSDKTYGSGTATFTIECDGSQLFASDPVEKGDKAQFVSIRVRGVRSLQIGGEGKGGPVSIWAQPRLIKGQPSRPTATQPVPPRGPRDGEPAGSQVSAPFVVDPRDLDKLAQDLWQKASANPGTKRRVEAGRIAIATFDLIDVPSPSVARNVAEDLYTAMINAGFAPVERGQLDKILKELKIQDSGLISPPTAQRIGQLSGCDMVLLGSISDRGQFVAINARLMDTATGKSLVAARQEMRKTPIARSE